eukprot:m.168179 g.168179  ORF g.168179 m.168179 type:complete len:498 (+) comp12926_c0_seq1:352-1845(+)
MMATHVHPKPSGKTTVVMSTLACAGSAQADYEAGMQTLHANPGRAAEFFEQAVKHGHAPAQAQLGRMLYHGWGVHRDCVRSARLLEAAARAGDVDGAGILGSRLVFLGIGGVAKDADRVAELCAAAIPVWRARAEQGCPVAQTDLGWCYLHGTGCDKDVETAVRLYHTAAEQNHVNALFNLAFCFSEGEGVQQDQARAVELYRTAAVLGHVGAERNLGTCYLLGKGVDADETEAVRWYRVAASKGDDSAQAYLGYCYEHGFGVPQNHIEAVRWYWRAQVQGSNWGSRSLRFIAIQLKAAADNGDASAQAGLGLCFELGAGVSKNTKHAANLFLQSSKADHIEGNYYLAKCYQTGVWKKKRDSNKQAVRLLCRAAEQGLAKAQCEVAVLRARGLGVERDGVKAVELCRLAAVQGHDHAAFLLQWWTSRLHKSCPRELRERVKLILLIGVRLCDRASYLMSRDADHVLPHLPIELWLCICNALRPIDFPGAYSCTALSE